MSVRRVLWPPPVSSGPGQSRAGRGEQELSVGQAGALAATGLIWSRSVQGREGGTGAECGPGGRPGRHRSHLVQVSPGQGEGEQELSVGQAGALAATGLIWSRSVQGREGEQELSVGQAGALAATGLIWSRSVQGREREQELSVGRAGALAATGLIWSRSVQGREGGTGAECGSGGRSGRHRSHLVQVSPGQGEGEQELSVGQAGALAATGLIWSRSVQGREGGTGAECGSGGRSGRHRSHLVQVREGPLPRPPGQLCDWC